MNTCAQWTTRLSAVISILFVALMLSPMANAQPYPSFPTPAELAPWNEAISQTPLPAKGCFHAKYPNVQWDFVPCARQIDPPFLYAPYAPAFQPGAELMGNASSFVAKAPAGHLMKAAVGQFLGFRNVLSPRVFYVQAGTVVELTTNGANTAACAGYTGCRAWQKYILSPITVNDAAFNIFTGLFIESWLINYGLHTGENVCPAEFVDVGSTHVGAGDDCLHLSDPVAVPTIVLENAPFLAGLYAPADANGTDTAIAITSDEAFATSTEDRYTQIATAWNQTQYNAVSQRQSRFPAGVGAVALLGMNYGSTDAPTCAAPPPANGSGTNNLIPGDCIAEGGQFPHILFSEIVPAGTPF
jgi:hypothetical protein